MFITFDWLPASAQGEEEKAASLLKQQCQVSPVRSERPNFEQVESALPLPCWRKFPGSFLALRYHPEALKIKKKSIPYYTYMQTRSLQLLWGQALALVVKGTLALRPLVSSAQQAVFLTGVSSSSSSSTVWVKVGVNYPPDLLMLNPVTPHSEPTSSLHARIKFLPVPWKKGRMEPWSGRGAQSRQLCRWPESFCDPFRFLCVTLSNQDLKTAVLKPAFSVRHCILTSLSPEGR